MPVEMRAFTRKDALVRHGRREQRKVDALVGRKEPVLCCDTEWGLSEWPEVMEGERDCVLLLFRTCIR